MINSIEQRKGRIKVLKEKTNIVYIVLIAAALIAIVCIVIFGLRGKSSPAEIPAPVISQGTESKVVYKEVEKLVEVEKTITAGMIEDGLRDMGVLITDEYYFTETVSFSSIKKFLSVELPFTESAYLASYDGVVTAGIDFSAVRVTKDDDSRSITVHIPKPEIQNIDIDPNSFRLYSEKSGLGNPISISDFNRSLVELEENARTRAVERGILERAGENAARLIDNFVTSAAGTGYSVKVISE